MDFRYWRCSRKKSIVLDLEKDALSENFDVIALLRKAKVVTIISIVIRAVDVIVKVYHICFPNKRRNMRDR